MKSKVRDQHHATYIKLRLFKWISRFTIIAAGWRWCWMLRRRKEKISSPSVVESWTLFRVFIMSMSNNQISIKWQIARKQINFTMLSFASCPLYKINVLDQSSEQPKCWMQVAIIFEFAQHRRAVFAKFKENTQSIIQRSRWGRTRNGLVKRGSPLRFRKSNLHF